MPALLGSAQDQHAIEIEAGRFGLKSGQATWLENHACWRGLVDERERGHDDAFRSPNSSIMAALMMNFWTLPDVVVGKVSTNLMYRGILKWAIWPRQKARMSSAPAEAPG